MRKIARTKTDAISSAARVANEYGLNDLGSIDDLRDVVQAAESAGVNNVDIAVDLGLATAIAYYSGMIFEVCAVIDGEQVSLGGGGRYDGLASALGSDEDVPALGFALNLDTISELTRDADVEGPSRKIVVLAPTGAQAVKTIVSSASELREQGHDVFTLFDINVDASEIAASLGNANLALANDDGSINWVKQ